MLTDSKLLASAAWDSQSLNELRTKAGQDPQANLRPVARQVEGMFVQMMLKSMRETLPKDGLFSSDQTRLYTSMYDQQIAQQMTAGKGLGLADEMVKQLSAQQTEPAENVGQVPMKFDMQTITSYQNAALTQMVRKALPKAPDSSDTPLSGDSKDFLAQLSLPARLASEQSGIPHHLILAQAALESGGRFAAKTVSRVSTCLVLKPPVTGRAKSPRSPPPSSRTARRRRSKPNSASTARIWKRCLITSAC